MKKKLLALFLVLVASIVLVCSCNVNSEGDTEGGNDNLENVIFSPATDLFVVTEPWVPFEYTDAIINAVYSVTGKMPQLVAPDSAPHEHEIVIGNLNREISKEAYSRLERYHLDVENEQDYSRYLVYTDGSSICIAVDNDEYNLAMDGALDYFLNNLAIGSTLVSEARVLDKGHYDLMAHLKLEDQEYRDKAWDKLHAAVMDKSSSLGTEESKRLADDFVDSMQNLYSIYNPDMVLWFANLYEPYFCVCDGECQKTKECGGGAFYYSNSGRDTVGYLPDTESTSQALGFISSSGMAYKYGSSYRKAISKEMADQVSYYVKNRQAPNGFFYNPQWPQSETDARLSRRARDLNWCVNMLNTFGLKPTYNTPSGVDGDGLYADGTPVNSAPAAYLPGPLGASAVIAVSKVISVSSTPDHLKDEESFKAYLATLDIHNSSYPVGNTLTSQTSQIKQTPGLLDILIQWLNENQNPATGHWDWKVEGDEGYSDYYGVNGLLKISGIYNSAKAPLPHAAEAAQSAIDAITADETMGAVVDLYNTWFSVSNILTNLANYSEDKVEGERLRDEIILSLLQQAPDAIMVSAKKIADFQKVDGSFSYGRNNSSATSQGMPVAVPGSVEGDVNATVIASTGLIGNIFSALQLASYKVPLFGEAERRIYMNCIDNLQPVQKDIYITDTTPATFDDNTIGEEPEDVEFKIGSDGGYVKVVDDPRTDKKDRNVLEFCSVRGNGDYVYVANNAAISNATTYIFEGDFCVLESNSSYVIQVTMGSAYMFIFKVSGGKVNIWDASSASGSKSVDTDLGLAPALGEWFNIRVEYYHGTHDSVRIKFYYNGKLAAVTDNYYNSSGTKITQGTGTPSKSFSKTNIYAMSDANIVMQLDNLVSYSSKDPYVAPTTDLPPVNVDAPDNPEKIYGFDEGNLDDIIVDGESAVVDKTVDGVVEQMLNLSGKITVPVNVRTKGSNCGTVVMDIVCDDVSSGTTVAKLVFKDNTSNSASIVSWHAKVVTVDGVKYLTLVEAPEGKAKLQINDFLVPLGEKCTLRIDFYHTEDMAIIYLNDEFVTASAPLYKNAAKLIFGKLEIEALNSALCIDNLICERNVASFEEAMKPEVDTTVNGFEGEVADGVLSGGATIVDDLGDKSVMLDDSGTAVIKIPVVDRSKVMTVAVFAFEFKMDSVDTVGTVNRFAFTDENGDIIFAIDVVYDGENFGLYEASAGGTREALLFRFPVSRRMDLRVEVYPDHKIANIYIGDECVAVSSVFYNGSGTSANFEYLEISSVEAGSVMIVDDVIAETLYKYYVAEGSLGDSGSGYNEEGFIDFEHATTGRMPSAVTSSLNSPGADVRIEKLIAANGIWSSVIAYETHSGGNDAVVIHADKDVTGASCIVFEADIRLDTSSGGTAYQIMFGNSGGAQNIAYMINLNVSGSNIRLMDCSSTGDSGNRVETYLHDVGLLKTGSWFKLRVEYYAGSKDSVRMRVFVNGTHVYTNDNYYGQMKDGNDKSFSSVFTCVRFYSIGAFEGTMYIDNARVYTTSDTCKEDVGKK